MAGASAGHDAVWARLETVSGVNAYDGEVPARPPVDSDSRVSSYAVLYYSPGRRYASALNGAQGSVDGTFQVTCVGGDPTRALWCVDRVIESLTGTPVVVDGVARRIRVDEGSDPGTVRRDDNVAPPRHYVPLRFRLHTP